MGSGTGFLAFLAVICLSIANVMSQHEASCVTALDIALASPNSDLCQADYEYMKCIVKHYSLHYLGVGSKTLFSLRNRIHSQLLRQGIDCDIDVLQVAREVRLEDLTERLNNTEMTFTDFATAADLEECTKAFAYASVNAGEITCDHGTSFAKCAARTTNMHTIHLTNSVYATFQEEVEVTLRELGVNCTIYVLSIIAELRQEAMITGVLQATTTTPPEATQSSSSQSQGVFFDNATTLADCLDAWKWAQPSINLDCDIVKAYTKCVLRSIDLPLTPLPPFKAKTLENDILGQLDALDLGCNVNIQEIINELLAEQTVEAVTEAIMVSTTTTLPTTTSAGTTTTTTTTPTMTTSATAYPVPGSTYRPGPVPSYPNGGAAPSFDDASDVGECTQALLSVSSLDSTTLNCEAMIQHVKCIFRVLDLQKVDLPPSLVRSFQQELENNFRILGLECVIDIQKILDDLQGMEKPKECVMNTPDACVDVENGDYALCTPQCQEGNYITCSNNYLYVRPCPLAWYLTPRGNRITAKMVFDPVTRNCQRSTPSCPRPLDQFIE